MQVDIDIATSRVRKQFEFQCLVLGNIYTTVARWCNCLLAVASTFAKVVAVRKVRINSIFAYAEGIASMANLDFVSVAVIAAYPL